MREIEPSVQVRQGQENIRNAQFVMRDEISNRKIRINAKQTFGQHDKNDVFIYILQTMALDYLLPGLYQRNVLFAQNPCANERHRL